MADAVEAVLAGGDGEERRTGDEAAEDLRHDIRRHVLPLEALSHGEADGDGGVEVRTGDVGDGVRHRQHGQAEGERDAEEADAQLDVGVVAAEVEGGEDGGSAPTEDEPEGAEEFGAKPHGQLGSRHG